MQWMRSGPPGAPTQVFLHGFAGGVPAWEPVLAELPESRVLGVWLPGHGPAAAPRGDFVAVVDDLAASIRSTTLTSPVHVIGYSLGARLVLGMLLHHGELFARATLVGAHPGLQSQSERVARGVADDRWEALLAAGDIVAFVDAWEAQPIFASQAQATASLRAAQRALRLQHDPRALASMLHATSLGRMPSFWEGLGALAMPVQWVAGALDTKFTDLAARACTLTPRGTLHVLPACGHNPSLEAPAALARCLSG